MNKAFNTVLKVLTALAAIAGVIYIVATYGEQIVAWSKRMLAAMSKCPGVEFEAKVNLVDQDDGAEEETAAETAEETVTVPAEEPVSETVVSEHEPVAEEKDFAE